MNRIVLGLHYLVFLALYTVRVASIFREFPYAIGFRNPADFVERIDKDHQSVGIVVGVIEPTGRRIISYGTFAKDDKRPLDGDTVFEIGSVTKVFTSLILADMVQRGEVALTDPIAKYLPPGQSPATRRPPDHPGRFIDTHLRPAANAEQFQAERSRQSLRRLLGRPALPISLRLTS